MGVLRHFTLQVQWQGKLDTCFSSRGGGGLGVDLEWGGRGEGCEGVTCLANSVGRGGRPGGRGACKVGISGEYSNV